LCHFNFGVGINILCTNLSYRLHRILQ
jgi:hypothetical protein